MEPEDLVLLDAFIIRHPEYSNRSNMARVAIRAFIEQLDGSKAVETSKRNVKNNVISVEVPRQAHETIMDLVRLGQYNSAEDAVIECIRSRYIDTGSTLEAIKRAKLEALKTTVQVIPE